jgi:hypothetical protein
MSPCLVGGCAEGIDVNWRPLIEFVVSVGYGVLSSVIPIFNSEIYIVASQVGGFTNEVTTAVGCAVGQAIGKVGNPSGQSFPYGATAAGATRAPPQAGRSRSNQAQVLVGPAAGTP